LAGRVHQQGRVRPGEPGQVADVARVDHEQRVEFQGAQHVPQRVPAAQMCFRHTGSVTACWAVDYGLTRPFAVVHYAGRMQPWLVRGVAMAVVNAAAQTMIAKLEVTHPTSTSVLEPITLAVLVGIAGLWGGLDGWLRWGGARRAM